MNDNVTQLPKQKRVGMKKAKLYDTIFFWAIAIIPLIMLVFNWVFINLNSILLAFKTYDDAGNATFSGLRNIRSVLWAYKYDTTMVQSLKNSVVVYLVSVVVTAVIPIIFSYYMFKKMWGSAFFKVILFMPSIVSSICTVTIFKFLVNRVIPTLFELEQGLLDNNETAFLTIMFYSLWLSFGSGMLTQIGAMNSTDQSTIDAGQIDGVGFFGELWHIVLPKSYGVISIGFYTGFASLFTNQLSLYAFKGDTAGANISTLGYYYYVQVQRATALDNVTRYPFWAAWGLISSAITIPVTFLLRYLVTHIGPSEE
jgi:ABC-type sugar transport system permease subunit